MLGVGEGRGGEGWAGLGWAGLGCRRSPQLSLLNVAGGRRTITIDLLQFPYALVSQTSKGPPVWRVTAGCMRDILYETDYTTTPPTLNANVPRATPQVSQACGEPSLGERGTPSLSLHQAKGAFPPSPSSKAFHSGTFPLQRQTRVNFLGKTLPPEDLEPPSPPPWSKTAEGSTIETIDAPGKSRVARGNTTAHYNT